MYFLYVYQRDSLILSVSFVFLSVLKCTLYIYINNLTNIKANRVTEMLKDIEYAPLLRAILAMNRGVFLVLIAES